MVQEIELSIAETNQLRAQLGLPLIPDPEVSIVEKVAQTSLTNDGANRLRMSLGLRPKQEEDGITTRQLEDKRNKNQEKRMLGEKKTAKQDKLFYNDIEWTESWLQNIGKKKREVKEPTNSRIDDDLNAEFTLAHADKVSELQEGEVLTLEDGGIMEEDEDDILVSEKMKKLSKEEKDKLERSKQALLEYGLRERIEEEKLKDEVKVTIKGNQILILKDVKDDDVEKSKGITMSTFDDLDEVDKRKAPVKMKKIKKTKKQSKKRIREIESEEPGLMFTVSLDNDEEDDNELELVLATSRKKKQKQRKMLTAEEIAHEVKLHLRADAMSEIGDGFVYDDTRDFLESIQPQRDDSGSQKVEVVADSKNEELAGNSKNEEIIADAKKVKLVAGSKEDEERKGTVEGSTETAGESKDNSSESLEDASENSLDKSGPKFNTLLDTLKYLRQNGQPEQNQHDKANRQAQKEAELTRIKISIEERIVKEELLTDHTYIGAPNEEKEKIYERVLNDRLVAKGIVTEVSRGKYSRYSTKDSLPSYNPQVRLRYTDSTGQELNTKQAWKELLHKYHGLEPKHKKRKGKTLEPNEKVIG